MLRQTHRAGNKQSSAMRISTQLNWLAFSGSWSDLNLCLVQWTFKLKVDNKAWNQALCPDFSSEFSLFCRIRFQKQRLKGLWMFNSLRLPWSYPQPSPSTNDGSSDQSEFLMPFLHFRCCWVSSHICYSAITPTLKEKEFWVIFPNVLCQSDVWLPCIFTSFSSLLLNVFAENFFF